MMNRRDFLTGAFAGLAAVARLATADRAVKAADEGAYWVPAIAEGKSLLDECGADWVAFPGLRPTPDGPVAVQYFAQRHEGGWRLVEVRGNELITRHTAHER